jgi:hypothetical protein
MAGAKTCTLDTKTGQIFLIASDRTTAPPAAGSTTPPAAPAGGRPGRGGGTFTILVVGREVP